MTNSSTNPSTTNTTTTKPTTKKPTTKNFIQALHTILVLLLLKFNNYAIVFIVIGVFIYYVLHILLFK